MLARFTIPVIIPPMFGSGYFRTKSFPCVRPEQGFRRIIMGVFLRLEILCCRELQRRGG